MDPVKAALNHLLSKALTKPCSAAGNAYSKLVQPIARFQLALDTLLPLLEDKNESIEPTQRILVSFILYSLYAPYPITVNPFKSLLYVTFVQEREKAVAVAKQGGTSVNSNEQLVWVLWKILKGDGNDIGPYTPNTLAQLPLPPSLRATNLIFNEETNHNISVVDDDYTYMYLQNQNGGINGQTSAESADTVTGEGQLSRERSFIDEKAERVAHGMKLLLAARERVLTLTEQRHVQTILPDLASSKMVTSSDLRPLVAYNPTLAYPLIVGLFTTKQSKATENNDSLPSPFLDVLPFLPPTLPTFDLLGRLLRDRTKTDLGSTIADLTRIEVLGRFIHESINWLERAEQDEKQGDVSDDRFAKGVQHLCRFYSTLVKMGIIDPTSDAECTEMMHFCLQYSKFEECTTLYRTLTQARS
ncbi:hypothetical protein BDN72DRAFT_773508 [Pluteus cervinus]|uniref:Uncharacterized protein n=1 Tax=Pluteus cervinus TaxID=181527 RepID=A0ACD3AHY2_9AGAR|nr:hypothetical protein BDN72DRAFT_773508 [Pluteus cervinus]